MLSLNPKGEQSHLKLSEIQQFSMTTKMMLNNLSYLSCKKLKFPEKNLYSPKVTLKYFK